MYGNVEFSTQHTASAQQTAAVMLFLFYLHIAYSSMYIFQTYSNTRQRLGGADELPAGGEPAGTLCRSRGYGQECREGQGREAQALVSAKALRLGSLGHV